MKLSHTWTKNQVDTKVWGLVEEGKTPINARKIPATKSREDEKASALDLAAYSK